MNHTDPAWEEYMSTGVDPTGGDIDYQSDSESSSDEEHED